MRAKCCDTISADSAEKLLPWKTWNSTSPWCGAFTATAGSAASAASLRAGAWACADTIACTAKVMAKAQAARRTGGIKGITRP
ncbi:MAG: hypothetical protein RL227_1752 [Pseudomonadota bacterium]